MNDSPSSARPILKPAIPIAASVLLMLIISLFFWLQSEQAAADPAITEHRLENGSASWSINPYSAQVLHNNLFTITIIDQSGKPVEGAALHIKLEMLAMLCGDYSFELAEAAPGTYSGIGIPLMAGLWNASLTITYADGQTSHTSRTVSAIH